MLRRASIEKKICSFKKSTNLNYSVLNSNEDLETVSLQTIIALVKDTLATVIAEKRAQVVIKGELPDLYTSASVVQLVLKNLIENGIKYNRSTLPIVEVSYREEEEMYCIQVRDNGIGIAPEYQSQIFDMFSRLHTQ